MIVDVHTRVWESSEQLGQAVESLRRRRDEPWNRPCASVDEHDAAMEPVANAVILGFESQLLGASIPHEKVAEYVARDPARYLGFAGIDPTAGHCEQSLERAINLGLTGVVISPGAQGVHPSDTRAMALYEACQEKRLPVLVESGATLARASHMEFSLPYQLDEVARTFPELRIVLSSLGHPWIEQGLALIAKHPTVYADLSELIGRPWQLYNALVLAHQHGVMNQLVFGSNFPFCTPEKAIVTIYSVNTHVQGTHMPTVPREQLRSIVERDTLSCLGLPTPDGPPRPAPAAADNGEAAADADEHAAPVEDAAP